MSFFKMFSGSSSKKSSKQKEKENAQPSRVTPSETNSFRQQAPQSEAKSPSSPSADDNVFLDEEAAASGLDISQFGNSRRKERNLSISRSGRHKYKAKLRSSVISGELYSTSSTDASPNGAGPSARTSSSGCREISSQSRLATSSSQPTAV